MILINKRLRWNGDFKFHFECLTKYKSISRCIYIYIYNFSEINGYTCTYNDDCGIAPSQKYNEG